MESNTGASASRSNPHAIAQSTVQETPSHTASPSTDLVVDESEDDIVRPSHQLHLQRKNNTKKKVAPRTVDSSTDDSDSVSSFHSSASPVPDTMITFELYGKRRRITPARRERLLKDIINYMATAPSEQFSVEPRSSQSDKSNIAPHTLQAQPARRMEPDGMAELISSIRVPITIGGGWETLQGLWKRRYRKEAARLGPEVEGWVPAVKERGVDGGAIGAGKAQVKKGGKGGGRSVSGGNGGGRKRKRKAKGDRKEIPDSEDELAAPSKKK